MEPIKVVENPKTETKELHNPPVKEIIKVLESGLKKNFASVEVNVVQCPDLMKPPFHLAARGLCGKPTLVDLGGVPYLIPSPQKDRAYDLKPIPERLDIGPDSLVLGAGAGPWFHAGTNCEMMANLAVHSKTNETKVLTHIATYESGIRKLISLPKDETRCALLANLLVCEGKEGPVIEVKCSRRTGETNFVNCMRNALAEHFKDEAIGLGGTFLIEEGKAKLHIMPDFSPCSLNSNTDIENWMHYYEASAPLVCLSVFISNDPGLDLRVEHTHCFSQHGEGGHYHYDTTPNEVIYRGFFVLAEKIVRIDRPVVTHRVGRD